MTSGRAKISAVIVVMPAGRLGVKPGDKVVFWPTTLDCWKEYPSSWPAGGEMTWLGSHALQGLAGL